MNTDQSAKFIDEFKDVILDETRYVSENVRDWVNDVDPGETFYSSELVRTLQNSSGLDGNERARFIKNVSKALSRLKDEGILDKASSRRGHWRKVAIIYEPIDFLGAPTKPFEIDLPLGLSKIVNVYPSDILCFAGKPNAGKTTTVLHIIKRNMERWGKEGIYYMTNELRDTSLRRKLELHTDLTLADWQFTAIPCFGDHKDFVKPDAINIFDWIAMADASYRIENVMGDIKSKLDKGIAIICIQKKGNYKDMKGREVKVELGTGGWKGVHYPTLYCAMDFGKAKIIKAKDWKTEENPNGKVCDFKIFGGAKMEWSEWYEEWKR